MECEVKVRAEGDVTVIDVGGDVDLYTAPRLEEALLQASAAESPRVVVNLARTTYLDSTALRILTVAQRRLSERQGALAIACAPGPIARLFGITGLDRVLPLCATEGEARERVRAGPSRPS